MSKLINVNCLHFIGCHTYKSHFISISSDCSTTIPSKHITSAATAVKGHVISTETAFSNSNVNYFWSIKNSSEVIEKLRLRNFQGSQVSSFFFSTFYNSSPHDLIKECCLWSSGVSTKSKFYLCTSVKAGFCSFLDLNIKVIGSGIHTSVYGKRNDFGFPIINFTWFSDDVPRLPSYGIYISQLVRLARCCTSDLDFHSKNLQIVYVKRNLSPSLLR